MTEDVLTEHLIDPDSTLIALMHAEARQYTTLPHQEVVALARRIAAGDREAFDTLIKHNLRLVIACIPPSLRDNLDLFQAGCCGLMLAAKRYDPAYATKFSTYAVPLIRRHVMRARYKDYLVHVPEPVQTALNYARKRLPDTSSDAEAARAAKLDPWVYRQTINIEAGVLSFDVLLPGTQRELYEVVNDPNADSVETAVDRKLQIDAVREVLKHHSQRNQQAFWLRCYYEWGYTEIGQQLGVSRERVRQIVNAVILDIQTRLGAQIQEVV